MEKEGRDFGKGLRGGGERFESNMMGCFSAGTKAGEL